MKRIAACLALVFAMSACDTTVTKAEMDTASYGPPPAHYKDEIRSYLDLRLTDPKSAIVEYRNEPKKLYQRGTGIRGEQYGWGVCVWVNDKNKAGAYDGYYPMTFVLRDEKIVAVNGGPDDSNVIGARFARDQCERLGAPFKQ